MKKISTIAAILLLSGTLASCSSKIDDLTEAAERGSADAKVELAKRYWQGRGVERDQFIAVKYAKEAADSNFGPALTVLGDFYTAGGGGLDKNEDRALEFYKKSAQKNGDARSVEKVAQHLSKASKHLELIDFLSADGISGSAETDQLLKLSKQKLRSAYNAEISKISNTSMVVVSNLRSNIASTVTKSADYVSTEYSGNYSTSRVVKGKSTSKTNGAYISGTIRNPFKHATISPDITISYSVYPHSGGESCSVAHSRKSFTEPLKVGKIGAQSTKKFEVFVAPEVKGRFTGICLNIFGVKPRRIGDVDSGSIKVDVTSNNAQAIPLTFGGISAAEGAIAE